MFTYTNRGFTLMELMVVVTIIGILAGISFPIYKEHVIKTRRTEAKDALITIAALQEKHYFQSNEYITDLTALYGGAATENGYYNLNIIHELNGTDCSTDKNCYTVHAEKHGAQSADENCSSFYLNSLGQRSTTNSSGGDTTSLCW